MADNKEPIFDVAQLAHVEILTPKPDETLFFFEEFLALEETEPEGQSVYLRAYKDFYHSTLKVTESGEAGMGHCAWRASSPQGFERRVQALKASGQGRGWIDGDKGHGPAYQFETPDGHGMELVWEVDYYGHPEGQKCSLLNRPRKRPRHGVPVRRLAHVNLMAADPGASSDFMVEQLGFRLREYIVDDESGATLGTWISVTNLAHDIAFVFDPTGIRGRLHHVCYWYGIPQHVYDIVELFKDADIQIEAGPGKHGISQAMFLYVYEPGGNRVELFSDSGYLIFDPTWKPVEWKMSEVPGSGDVWVGHAFPWSWWNQGTPLVEVQEPASVEG